MKSRSCLLLALLLGFLALPVAGAAPSVDFSEGFEATPMALNAGAALLDGRLRLTDMSSGSQSRSAYHVEKVKVDRFVTRFVYRAAEVRPAKVAGWAFVLQNEATDAVGESETTGTRGYAPTDRSVALVMDLRGRIALRADPPDGDVQTLKSEPLRPEMGDFADGHPYEFLLAYDGEVLRLIVTDLQTDDSYYLHYAGGRTGEAPLDIPALVGGERAWAGFTAGTGSKPERRSVQEIESWVWYADEGAMPPVAQFTLNALSPYQALEGNVVRAKAPYKITFDAGTSFDVDGEVAGHEWDFGDGVATDREEPVVEHTYEEPGTYEASLTVVDDDGNRSDPRSFEVVVSDALAPVIEPHRTSGVAPLFVSFDATGTDGLAEGDFLNARFGWEFDVDDADPDGRYEHGEGFMSGHVFEEPGTYRVKLTVTDVSGETAATETEIVVDAVDDSWTTYHFAADGDDANPGTIERPKRTPAHGLRELAGPKVRIRFRRGDAWKLDRSVEMTAHGPVIVDAYTDPDQPSEEPPIIEATWTDGAYFMLPISGRDWRLMDLAIRAGSNSYSNPREPGGAYLSGRDNMVAGVRFTKLGARVCPMRGDGNALYDCRASEAGAYFVFGSPHRFAIIGNDVEIESEHEEHVLRFQGGHKGYIAHNKLRAKKTKSNVQMRGATSQMVAYDNDLIGRTSNTSPQNDASEEYVHHVLWEGNRFLYEPAYEDISRFGAAGTAVGVNARHIVIRNNLTVNYGRLFGTGGHVWVGPSVDVHVYNNSVYADDTAGKHRGRLGDVRNARLVTVRNNLLYNTVTARPDPWVRLFQVGKRGIDTLTADHNLLWAPAWDAEEGYFEVDGDGYSLNEWHELGFGRGTLLTEPRLRSAVPGNEGFMRLTPDSPAVDAGAAVPVFIDHQGRPRGEAIDIGAFELADGHDGP